MNKKSYLVIIGALVLILLATHFAPPFGYILLNLSEKPLRTPFVLIVSFIVAFTVYILVANVIKAGVLRSRGTEGEMKRIVGLWRFTVIFLTLVIILSFYFQLGVIDAFGGMFLGWSLQRLNLSELGQIAKFIHLSHFLSHANIALH